MNIVLRDAERHPAGIAGYLAGQLPTDSIVLVYNVGGLVRELAEAMAERGGRVVLCGLFPDWPLPNVDGLPVAFIRESCDGATARTIAQQSRLIVLDVDGAEERRLLDFLRKRNWNGVVVRHDGAGAEGFDGRLTIQEWAGEADLGEGPLSDPPLVHVGQRVFVGGAAACDHYGRKFPLRIHIRSPKETGDCLHVLALKPTWGDTVIEAAGVPFSERNLQITAARARQPGDLFIHCATGEQARELAAWCCSQRLKK